MFLAICLLGQRVFPAVPDAVPLSAPGALPGTVIAFGPEATVLACAKDGSQNRPILAAATYGKGRVIVCGHGALLSNPGNQAVADRLILWVGNGGKVVAGGRFPTSAATGLEYKDWRPGDSLDGVAVLNLGMGTLDNRPDEVEKVRAYVKAGGGLIVSGPGWGWAQLNPGKKFEFDMSAQQVVAPMGVALGLGTVDGDGRGKWKIRTPVAADHAGDALRMLKAGSLSGADLLAASSSLEDAFNSLSLASGFRKQLEAAIPVAGDVNPTKEKPTTRSEPLARLAARQFDAMWRSQAPSKVKAHPAAATFPGAVPAQAKRETVVVKVGTNPRRWMSTGRYAAPGEVIRIEIPTSWEGKGVRARIGGHRDDNWDLQKWERWPSITLEKPIEGRSIEVANPFGGLIYLVADGSVPVAEVKIAGSVEAPVFEAGVTPRADWSRRRQAPAPWGEIAGKYCVVSVPSDVLRTLDDPQAVADYWDEVVRHCEDLYAVPHGRGDQRYQVDRQIVAGYMHAGYPIMTWEDVSARFVDVKVLRGNSGGPLWGFYHEMGHNFQKSAWTWSGWGETTNNLFSLYGAEVINGDKSTAHGAMNEAERQKRLDLVRSKPGAERYFDKDPWYGLTMLAAIQREFGWSAFTTIFRGFESGPQPRNEQEKQDELCVRLSTLLKRNFAPYFRAWGAKVSEDAAGKCAAWPMWTPKGW
jgi:hypothetical protein